MGVSLLQSQSHGHHIGEIQATVKRRLAAADFPSFPIVSHRYPVYQELISTTSLVSPTAKKREHGVLIVSW